MKNHIALLITLNHLKCELMEELNMDFETIAYNVSKRNFLNKVYAISKTVNSKT